MKFICQYHSKIVLTMCYVVFCLYSDEMKLELDAVPSPEEFQYTMQLSNIVTMASSPANQPVVKFFFYAQHVSHCSISTR